MKKRWKSILLRYGIATLVGALMAVTVFFSHGYADAITPADKYRVLCDAFTIPGIFLILVGALVFVSNEGAFYGISYALGRFFRMLNPFAKKTDVRYGDYVEEKQAKGKTKGYSFLFFVGLAFVAVALVFLALFYKNF